MDILTVPVNIISSLGLDTYKLHTFNNTKILKEMLKYSLYTSIRTTSDKLISTKAIKIQTIVKVKNKDIYMITKKTSNFYKKYKVKNVNKNNCILGESTYILKNSYGHCDIVEQYKNYLKMQTKNKPVFKAIISEIDCITLLFLVEVNKRVEYMPKKSNIPKIITHPWVTLDELIDKYGQYYSTSKVIIDYLVENNL